MHSGLCANTWCTLPFIGLNALPFFIFIFIVIDIVLALALALALYLSFIILVVIVGFAFDRTKRSLHVAMIVHHVLLDGVIPEFCF